MSLDGNMPKNAKKGPKMIEKRLKKRKVLVPRFFFVDSEAHQSEISCYLVKNEMYFVQGWKYAKNMPKTPKNDQKRPKIAKLANFENF